MISRDDINGRCLACQRPRLHQRSTRLRSGVGAHLKASAVSKSWSSRPIRMSRKRSLSGPPKTLGLWYWIVTRRFTYCSTMSASFDCHPKGVVLTDQSRHEWMNELSLTQNISKMRRFCCNSTSETRLPSA
jgi:hypothetical protein